ncbi:hypothetical protein ACWKWA_01040 [Dermacoccus abyssi]
MAVGLIEDEVREQSRSRAVDPSTEPEKVRSIIAEIVSATELARARAALPALPSAKDEAKAVFDAVAGFGPLQPYLDDPSIEEIWLNEPPFVGNFLLDWRPSISGGVSTRASRFADTRAPRGSGHQCVNGGILVGLKVRIDRSGGQRCCRVKTWSSSPAVPRRRC